MKTGVMWHAVAWHNDQWAVMQSGNLRCIDREVWINRRHLMKMRGSAFEWPMVMAQKSWVEMHLFMAAWRVAVQMRIDDAMSETMAVIGEDADDADAWLMRQLAHGPIPVVDVVAAGKRHGYTRKQLRSARQRIGAQSINTTRRHGGWVWHGITGHANMRGLS
jgi:hypothetical protein